MVKLLKTALSLLSQMTQANSPNVQWTNCLRSDKLQIQITVWPKQYKYLCKDIMQNVIKYHAKYGGRKEIWWDVAAKRRRNTLDENTGSGGRSLPKNVNLLRCS